MNALQSRMMPPHAGAESGNLSPDVVAVFAHMQERFSDAELAIKIQHKDAQVYVDTDEREMSAEVIKFPAHLMALVRSEFFNAQVDFQEAQGSAAAAARPQLEVTVDDAAHVAVMERVINCLYLDSMKQASAFSGLSQQQLVLAVKYGDMIQFHPAREHASRLLQAAVVSDGLHVPAMDALCELESLPDLLVSLLPELMNAAGSGSTKTNQLLLNAMADLERVWEQPQLQEALLRLPLESMELLLSSNQLSVSSEDTVMYTVGEYVCGLPQSARAVAADKLGPLIRCQCLSNFQLMAQAVNTDTTAFNVLKRFQSLLRVLMTMRRVPISVLQTEVSNALLEVLQKGTTSARTQRTRPDDAVDAAFKGINAAIRKMAAAGLPPGAPESWLLPARNFSRVIDKVQLMWQVDVADIRKLYQSCCKRVSSILPGDDDVERVVNMHSTVSSPPLSGLSWKLSLQCIKKEGGVEIGLFLKLRRGPGGVALSYHMMLQGASIKNEVGVVMSVAEQQVMGWGWPDFFGLGLVHGGFEKSAWVTKKNLPVSGVIEFKATVSSLN